MKATVTWQDDLIFNAETDSGKKLVLDGNRVGLSPMEAVLISMGTCAAVDVVEILKKSRQDLQDCRCELSAERAEEPPRVFTKVHAHYVVKGKDIGEKQLKRAVELSTEKYCSVMLMFNDKVDIKVTYEAE